MNMQELLILLLFTNVKCHVSLNYPKARKYDLDFLDSFRTSGECGMNSGQEKTILEAGALVNITWSLGYPHGGGFKLELVHNGNSTILIPGIEWELTGRETQHHLITVPDEPCTNCYIRLQRQAMEWGSSYVFRSCADVAILAREEYVEDCSGHGTPSPPGSRGCSCERLHHGHRCQYIMGCNSDEDCNGPKGQGQCVQINNAVFPERQCFCSLGWFGEQCENRSLYETKKLNETGFTKQDLGGPLLYWRKYGEDDIEIVFDAPTISWVAVGWRPKKSDKSCQNFPEDVPAPKGTDFHAMDCTDMVVGMAKGEMGRLGDYYTRDRSTPRVDSFWGGVDGLESGAVWEEDGRTVMIFRRKVGGGEADHPLKGKTHFIWATGQSEGFYGEDQFKWHGGTRGKLTIDFSPSLGVSSGSVSERISMVTLFILLVATFTFTSI